ncbi:BLUF domain-containing protein [Mucilaginibacter sp. RB4R14]|nr:BLUF domain-containing protein [Mucilaginibacter aurantiaciroseus]
MDITGLLLYNDGAFMQVLEGYEDPVKQIYHKFEIDKRHTCVIKTAGETMKRRIFTDWAMAFAAVSGMISQVKEFISPHNISCDPNYCREPIVMLKALLNSHKPWPPI